jgi:hypothetical protein
MTDRVIHDAEILALLRDLDTAAENYPGALADRSAKAIRALATVPPIPGFQNLSTGYGEPATPFRDQFGPGVKPRD